MKNLTDKEKKKRYGQVICDFVNAENSDDALLTYFKSVQELMGFSESFIKESREKFPTLDLFNELAPEEKRLIKLIVNETPKTKPENALEDLVKYLGLIVLKVKFPDVKFMTNPGDYPPPGKMEDSKSMHFDEFVKKYEPQYFPDYESDMEVRQEKREIMDRIYKVRREQKEIIELKSSMKEGRIDYLKDKTGKFKGLLDLHEQTKSLQKEYRRIIQSILEEKRFQKIKGFEGIVKIYNESSREALALSAEKGIIKKSRLNETNYFSGSRLEPLKSDLAFFLIEFLLEADNYKYILKCEKCEQFFIGKTKRPKRFCSDKCRLDWHNRRRIESGEHAKYKREKREKGAKESYYG